MSLERRITRVENSIFINEKRETFKEFLLKKKNIYRKNKNKNFFALNIEEIVRDLEETLAEEAAGAGYDVSDVSEDD